MTLKQYIQDELITKKGMALEDLKDHGNICLDDATILDIWTKFEDEVCNNACWSDMFNDSDRSIATYLFDIIKYNGVVNKNTAMRELVEDAVTREADEITGDE